MIVKDHLIKLFSKSLGDTIALMPYLELYRLKHNCNVYFYGNRSFHNLFTKSYPNIIFVNEDYINSRSNPFDNIVSIQYDFHNPVQQGMALQLGF